MRKSTIRNFPQEAPYSPWPLLHPTLEDRQYLPKLESREQQVRRLQRESRELLYLDLRASIPKGAILGLFCFGLVAGIVLNLPFWLQGWHWAFATGGAIVFGVLIGLDLTLVILALGALAVSIFACIADSSLWLLLPFFIAGGIVIRVIIEILPYSAP